MAEPALERESVGFHDPRDMYHPGISVAIDRIETKLPEDFIHAETPNRFVIAATDASEYFDETHLAGFERRFIRDGRDDARSWLRGDARQREIERFNSLMPQPAVALAMERKSADGPWEVVMTRAKTPALQMQEGVLASQLSSKVEGTSIDMPWMRSTAANIQTFVADALAGEHEFLLVDASRKRRVAVDAQKVIAAAQHIGFEDREIDGFYKHNDFLMLFGNMMSAEYMCANQIPGIVLAYGYGTDERWTWRTTLADDIEDNILLGGYTSPFRSSHHAMTHANLYAFFDNPAAPDYPFPDDRLQEIIHKRRDVQRQEQDADLGQNVGVLVVDAMRRAGREPRVEAG